MVFNTSVIRQTYMILTIFTPTYNRKDRLLRAYESLKAQSVRDFIWIIVDDGSDDGTGEEVERLMREAPFEIRYHRQENGGKMRAHNRGVMMCDTEAFLCLDSDDHLSQGAVNDILDGWNKIRDDERYAGIIAYKGESEDKVIYGNHFPDTEDSSFRELYRKGFKGETTLVLRTDLLKANLFPEIEGEKYVPEDVVYDRIDEGHIFKVMDRIFTVCELVDEGLTDRADKLRHEAPTGWFIYYYQRAASWPFGIMKIKFASHYLRFEKLVDKEYREHYALGTGIRLMGYPGALALGLFGKL